MRYHERLLGYLLLLSGAALVGCTGNAANQRQGGEQSTLGRPVQVQGQHQGKLPIQVVCTTEMVADLVRNVGKQHVAVKAMLGEGVDPHLYKATPGDRALLSGADLILYSGLHLEGKMGEVLVGMGKRKTAVAVAEHIPASLVHKDEKGHLDPHVWFDVSAWSQAAGVVRDVLVAYDPPRAEEYRQNAQAYQAELAQLHEYAKARIGSIPKEQRVLVTAHDAFRYFGKAYEIEVKGIQGISTESEAGVMEVNQLVRMLTERRIKAVFIESSVSNRNIKSLLEGCQAKGHSVVIGGELFSDAMGKAGTPEGSYVGMVRHNVETIVKALK